MAQQATVPTDSPVVGGPESTLDGRAVAEATERDANGGPPALQLHNIRAGYGNIEVLHGVSLVVPAATVVALLGPNGAGKSTTLKVAAGLVAPTGGCVHMAGSHVNNSSPEARARAGLASVPEGRGIFPNLSVRENLAMVQLRRRVEIDELEADVYKWFPVLGQRRSQLAGTLSGGEQQMLSLARAMATSPGLLLLDEISMGLAPLIVGQLYELVGEAARGGTAILLVEQFARAALRVADYVAVMVQGRITLLGEPAEVGDRLAQAYLGTAA
ncbi:MAG TPA: ABC transporter ATP-binding protein [Acidimicrobiales bacterium]|nr:ABC transporter ATP-binding protein [Acidimicrobiales bacterium]